jgi:hypothetical protein
MDKMGCIYLAGNFGPANHDYISKRGIYLAKYNAAGTAFWKDTSRVSFLANTTGVVADSSGNAYIVGMAMNTIRFGSFILSGNSGYMYLVKYDPQGTVLWARQFFNCGGQPQITISNNSLIYIAGVSGPSNNYSTQIDTFTVTRGFIATFDNNGACVNARSGYSTHIWTIACDGTNIFFCDQVSNNLCYLRKYDPLFNQVWAIPFSDPGYIKADNLGNCYMWGWFYGGSTSFGSTTLYNPYASNGHPIGYAGVIDANGNDRWAVAPADSSTTYGIGYTSTNIFVTGCTGYLSFGGHNLYTAKYNLNGTLISKNIFTAELSGTQLIGNAQGDIYVAGNYISASDNYIFLSKISYNNPTSIKDQQTPSALSLAPNPTSGIFQLNYSASRAGTVTLNILNAKGQLLSSEKIKTEGELHRTLDLSSYAKGVYLIELVNGEARAVKRVVIE